MKSVNGRRILRLGVAVLVAAIAAAAFTAFADAAVAPTPQASSNWAGYVVSTPAADPATGATAAPLEFTNVTGTWVQPKGRCTRSSTSSAAFWVGLGGASESSSGLEQIGTTIDCRNGAAVHSAWWELIPAPAVPIRMKIVAGDTITAAVLVRGTSVTLQLTNRTRGTRFTKTLTVAEPDLTSAEWVAEAPSLCSSAGRCRVVPLANFGAVRFTAAAATANAHPGVISDDAWTAQPVQLRAGADAGFGGFFGGTGNSTGNALPGGVSPDGRAFSVAWAAAA
jgi:hypothetical protein